MIGAAGVAAALLLAAAPAPPPGPSLAGSPACGASVAPATQPQGGRSQPPVAPRYLPADFPTFVDSGWGYPVGGIGGRAKGAALHHTPVIFVHGNQADAQNWLSVMQQFVNVGGHDLQELYAISYNGLGNFYGGAPVANAPTAADQAYFTAHSAGFANGGHGAANDDEVPDLCRFIEEVQWYTGSRQVNIVAHSLGVTITRKLMHDYPALAQDVVAFVGVAGANHGTSVCRGLETSYYGCDEIAPGSPWLAALNAGGETPGPTAWMTISNGSAGDPFFNPPADQGSPQLQGADNRTFTGAYHNDLRVGVAEVDTYLPFLLRHGQAGPGMSSTGVADAARIESTQPNGLNGPGLCVPGLTDGGSGCPVASASGGGSTPTTVGSGGIGAAPGRAGGGALPATGRSPLGALFGVAALVVGLVGRRGRRAVR